MTTPTPSPNMPTPEQVREQLALLERFPPSSTVRHPATGRTPENAAYALIYAERESRSQPYVHAHVSHAMEQLAALLRAYLDLRAQVEAQRWVSVEERLPEAGAQVLFLALGSVKLGARSHGLWSEPVDDWADEEVSHWRPAEAPK